MHEGTQVYTPYMDPWDKGSGIILLPIFNPNGFFEDADFKVYQMAKFAGSAMANLMKDDPPLALKVAQFGRIRLHLANSFGCFQGLSLCFTPPNENPLIDTKMEIKPGLHRVLLLVKYGGIE